MFKRLDSVKFGEYIRKLRNSQNMTQDELAEKACINVLTIRRIEKGYNIPTFQVISNLSNALKADIHKALIQLSKENDLMGFYHQLDELLIQSDEKRLTNLIQEFSEKKEQLLQMNIIDQREIMQFEGILEGLLLSCKNLNNREAFNSYLNALRLTIPSFSIEEWTQDALSYLEMKCVLLIALELNVLDEYKSSNDLSLQLLSYLNNNVSELIMDNIYFLKIKIYLNISYNYHGMDLDDEAYSYANYGIEYCLEKKTIYLLHGLYYRRAVALFYLNKEDRRYIKDFKTAFIMLRVQGYNDLLVQYISITESKYGIKIDLDEI